MGISSLYNKTVTLKRLQAVSGTHKEAWEDVVDGDEIVIEVACAIHPIDGTQQEILEGGFFNTFKMFCSTDDDIQIGDRVIDGDDTYTVKGIRKFNFAGTAESQHQNILLVKNA